MKYLDSKAAFIGVALALVGLVGAGCEKEQSTKEKRSSVSRKTARFMMQGGEALKQGAYNVTLAMADSAEKYAPELADVYFLRARALTELKRFDKAQAAYEKVLSLDPQYQGVRLNLGNNAFRQDQYRQALGQYQEEQRHFPTADVLTRIGFAYKKLGKADSALGAFRRALDRDSLQKGAHMGISQIHEERGEMEAAIDHARQALKQDPENLEYRYTTGNQLLKAGRPEEAADYLEKVVQERSQYRKAQYALGQALARLGRKEEAQRHLARADSLKKMNRILLNLRDQTEKHPNKLRPWVQLGGMQMRTGRLEEATESYKVALSLAPRDLGLQTNLATLLLHRKKPKEAIQRYRTVLQQDSTLADVWLNLGVAHAVVGNKGAARNAWQKALQYKPGDPTAKAYLARLSN